LTSKPEPFRDSIDHVLSQMKRLDLMLRRAVLVARHSRSSDTPEEFRGLVISEEHVDRMLESVDFLGDIWKLDSAQARIADSIDRDMEIRQESIRARMEASAQAGEKLALAHLASTCGLSPAEVDVLLIALAPELEPRYETLYAYLQNDVTRKRPSKDLCLNLICRTEQEKIQARGIFSPDAPLLYFHLIELHEESYDRNPSQLRYFLRMDDTVTRLLLERQPRRTAAGQLISADTSIDDLATSAASRTELKNLVEALNRNGTDHVMIQLYGGSNSPLKEAAESLAQALGKDVLYSDLSRLDADSSKLVALIRDAAMWDNLLVLDRRLFDSRETERSKRNQVEEILLARTIESNIPVVLLSSDEQPGELGGSTHLWRINVQPPDFETRREAWRIELAEWTPDMDLDHLADVFSFSGKRVQQTVSLARAHAALRDPADPKLSSSDVLAAGRDLTSPNMQRFAISIEPRFGWDDLVLPPDQIKQLHGISARFQFRSIVHRKWEFGAKLSRGGGLSVLFTGPSGTGKTTAAEVMARDLSLRLFQIDLATVVSKYIGETEANLSVIFREAEMSQSLLFFDEADALYGKRTEVKDAHDRYANIEVNYLLQRIEQYQGLVVLATNFQENIDNAFLRRLHCVVRFPFPDERAREQIWRLQFPEKAPVAPGVDFAFLARQFKISGGYIHNAAVEAAFQAVQEGGVEGQITMEHIIGAVKHEYQKQGKLVMKDDLGPYAQAS
jgi:ATPase family associated with various cellular activities (AAA)